MSFEAAFQHTVGIEGGYSDHPSDRGGPTKFGITEQVARANGYKDDMKEMPLYVAQRIYRIQYWDIMRLDTVDAVSPEIAEELFDTGVNMGVGTAGKFLQRALNVFNKGATAYPDLTVDGVIGPVTVSNLKSLLTARGEKGKRVLLNALNAQQGVRYIEIAEKNPSQEDFEFGWWLNRVGLS